MYEADVHIYDNDNNDDHHSNKDVGGRQHEEVGLHHDVADAPRLVGTILWWFSCIGLLSFIV